MEMSKFTKQKIIKQKIIKRNREIKKLNINKTKKYLKDYYKNTLYSFNGLPEAIFIINNMTKRDLYCLFKYDLYKL